MTNERRQVRSEHDSVPPGGDEILSTAVIAGGLQPGDEVPSEKNLVRPRAEATPPENGDPRPEPAQPAGPAQPEERAQPAGPARAAAPAEPATPAQPAAPAQPDGRAEPAEERAPLFGADDAERFQSSWRDVQTGFVDDPRAAVRQADQLVAKLMQDLARTFTAERDALERQWDTGSDVSTEDLRIAMRRYRSFFSRLLSL